jgi:hypothetical protein
MPFESRYFWERPPQPPWPTSLQPWFQVPGCRCATAIASMEQARSNARRCVNCRNTRIAGGRPPAIRRVPLRRNRHRRIRNQTRTRTHARQTALKKLAGRFVVRLFPGSTFPIWGFPPVNRVSRHAFPRAHPSGNAYPRKIEAVLR